jgi:cell division septum initiation protein DivIVA
MSVEAPFFRWTEEEILHPQFTKVLKGFDSEEVETFITELTHRIQQLEENLQQVLEERDQARRRYASVQAEAYRQVAGRMADVLRTADGLAEKLRREAEEEARRTVADAANRASDLRKHAEAEAARLRADGHRALEAAEAKATEIMTHLQTRRQEMRTQFESVKLQTTALLEQADRAILAATAKDVVEPAPASVARVPTVIGSAATLSETPDDLLAQTQSFEIVVIDDQELERGTGDRRDG